VSRSPIGDFAGSGAGGSSLVLALCPRRALTAGGCTRLRAAPVPECTIHSATEKRKGPLAPFTADRSAPRGSLGYVAGDPQLPGGTRLTLAPRPPGLLPRPARPTRGAWPVARLQAARCAPRASAGAASRLSSGPFEVEARTQGIPRGVLPRASLTERSIRRPPTRPPSSANRTLPTVTLRGSLELIDSSVTERPPRAVGPRPASGSGSNERPESTHKDRCGRIERVG